MITKRDREIISFIYDFGFITIQQCSKIFYRNCISAYDLARRRLSKIEANGNYIKSKQNTETKQILYVPKDSSLKGISIHDKLIIDYLAELYYLGADIENCFIEKNYDGVIPDAVIVFTLGSYRYYQILEIQLRHDIVDISRYEKALQTILQDTNNTIPTIIIVQDTRKDYYKDNKTDFDIIQIKTDLKGVGATLQ